MTLSYSELMLQEFGQSLYFAEGPTVSFFGFPYPTRMAVIRLSDGSAWVWSPVALSDELANSVESVGPVRFIVSPNKIHHLFLSEWAGRWPDARLYAPPGLIKRKPELNFDAELGDEADPAWATGIDQVIFHGSILMKEVVFFHRQSRCAIVCDLIQRHPEVEMTGWKGQLMRLDGLVGEHGSTPREWRASFLRRGAARTAREKLLSWNAERLLIAHGDCAQTGANEIITDALSWI
ncbi:DUF4336 domain-containing protein [Pseudomonadota bacterium]